MNKSRSILIVDDDPKNRALAMNYLETSGISYNIFAAPDGLTALEIARAEFPDLIILDWQMPKMDGMQVLKRLKSDPATERIPVIMYTGIMTDAVSLRKALEYGAFDFLRKPVEPIEMEARIHSVINLIDHHNEKLDYQKRIGVLEKQSLELELENRRKEVSSYAMFLAERNEITFNLISELKQVATSNLDTRQVNNRLETIINGLETKLSSVEFFDRFYKLFQQLHPEFMHQIRTISDKINADELKYLALMKMNLSIKEISLLINISEPSLPGFESSIRHKLKVSEKDSLIKFVETIGENF